MLGRSAGKLLAAFRHYCARLIRPFVAERAKHSFGAAELASFIFDKGSVISFEGLVKMVGAMGMFHFEQLQRSRFSFHDRLVDQTDFRWIGQSRVGLPGYQEQNSVILGEGF